MADSSATPRVVVIVVFDDVTMLDVAGAGEVFAEANRFGADYLLKIASVDGRDVTTSIGTRLGVTDAVSSIESADTVLVAGSDNLPRRPIDPELVEAVKSVADRTRRLASICTGSFILGQAGLLDGRRATTHWHDVRLFARAFPEITVEPDALFVCDGDVFTSAGISSGIDLALALVEMDYGTELVRAVARWLVVYLKRAGGQSQFSALVEAEPPPRSPLRKVTAAISADPAADHSVKSLSARASLSTRQLTRLFQSELGTTPARYVEMVRIDAARAALDAGRSVAESARLAGFGSAETLRRVFVEHLGLSPKAYRDRFRTAARG
ncbi:bacterial regulatory helix-turn-helix s, AraC family protein [Mycobacterium avium subsp. avium 2285 (R)]|uniref:Transcriptional regulator, AraC family protein n=1 Tax=Mycobacterium avium (strain 104) TaxID=243243 RepID=A0A0H2ZR73_MYCA1|nr:transcriptional regulator, AraC family protein [Mycobacterium avium 104]ETZ49310.1 bacterial regulatory helix-turn-helix s, AraC family protein [Mycobacterium avium MAV_061107_1842]ETZ57874.1 bacterial regulatory helix-turn-helix s, AraC family protein [Mycobacterium avium MAV_120709_2344]EUA37308.1 bacterial regulatory helix-turn-helix s, AraC family protein [Mycobacterium avium subsp. avium 2285 (R)]